MLSVATPASHSATRDASVLGAGVHIANDGNSIECKTSTTTLGGVDMQLRGIRLIGSTTTKLQLGPVVLTVAVTGLKCERCRCMSVPFNKLKFSNSELARVCATLREYNSRSANRVTIPNSLPIDLLLEQKRQKAQQKSEPFVGFYFKESGRQDSNLRPPVPKTGALPGCATPDSM